MSPAVPCRRARRGFTLIELLMVIVILALLTALLLPAVNSVMRQGRVAQVRTEISGLSDALAAFKTQYGSYPPSSITLREEGGTWSAADMGKIRGLFPQFDFNIDRDFDGDGSNPMDVFTLRGAECLVFFLGGMMDHDTTNDIWAPVGFSTNPANPFSRGGSTRVGPFFEFKADRLVAASGNLPVYFDPLAAQQNPYVYASSYEGTGYVNADVSGFLANGVYRQTANSNAPGHNPKSFQIISPGADGAYGLGGVYIAKQAKTLLSGSRAAEQDNITNFQEGLLGQ